MPPEIITAETTNGGKSSPRWTALIWLIVAAILLAAGLIYIGQKYPPAGGPPEPSVDGLTEAEKAEILKSLQRPPNTPPLTAAEKAEILKSLQRPPNTPPLTEAEQAEILKSLK